MSRARRPGVAALIDATGDPTGVERTVAALGEELGIAVPGAI